jgi:hypothetical protein
VARLLNRLGAQNSDGPAFKALMNKNFGLVEDALSNLTTQLAAITAAQATATAAAASATAAARESARINSYPNPGSVLTAADAGTDASITIANHTRVYPVQGSIDVADVAITGATLTALSFSTQYWVYYDDTTLAVAAPTFHATTSSATAQVGAAAGRHLVGFITTPADGAGGTSGGYGGGTPGGGGGGGTYGGAIP